VRGDGERLREIAIASKGLWGHDPVRVHDWASGLDLSDKRLQESESYVAEVGGRAVGWVEVLPAENGVCVLDHLWVEPAWVDKGVGSRLFGFAASRGARLGGRTMEWEAEPNATGFYEKMGGRFSHTTLTQWGREVPVMQIDLE
jgi:GNAT superfamily N-acetyltransferase